MTSSLFDRVENTVGKSFFPFPSVFSKATEVIFMGLTLQSPSLTLVTPRTNMNMGANLP